MTTRLFERAPQVAALSFDAGAWSRKGSSRSVNEDSFAAASLGLSPGPLLLVVADGMGGEVDGQRASRIAVRSMVDFLACTSRPWIGPGDLLKDALIQAHRDILADAEGQIWRMGMGTTLTAAIVLGKSATVVHAGDSRCTLLHRGRLRLLTTDHTAAEVLVARGQMTREAARTSRFRNILTNHLGGDVPMPEPELIAVDLEPGDGLLLTTDGLHDALGEPELADIASRPCSAHAVCHMLVEAAQARGTRDDATAVFARSAP